VDNKEYEVEGYLVVVAKFSVAIWDVNSFSRGRRLFRFPLSENGVCWEGIDKLDSLDEKLKRVIVFCDKLIKNKVFW
jgi:hypothetical protein